MSAQHSRGPHWLFLAAIVILVRGGSARADDLLDKVAGQQKIATQKARADIKTHLAQARKLEDTNPQQAKAHLRTAEFLLEDAQGLSESERTALAQQIQRGLRQADAALRERDRRAAVDADRAYSKQLQAARQRDLEMRSGYKAAVGQAGSFLQTGSAALGQSKMYRDRFQQGFLAINSDIMDSASRITEERFTERYRKKLELGLYGSGPKLTPAEKTLLKMLNSTLSVNFQNTPLKQVLEYLHDKTNGKMPIFLDEPSLKEVDVDYDTPITFKTPKVTMRSVLKKILADKGLTYIIKEAAIHVMTPAKARENMVVRVYSIGDLLPTPNPGFGQFMNQAQQIRAAQGLMQLIVSTVDPASWQVNGGAGSIIYDAQRMALVVRQSAEWHYQMAGKFGN